MIKHIITSDAIIIPTSEGILQYGKDDINFERILALCLNPQSTLFDLQKDNFNLLNYEDDDITLNYNKKSEEYELFYNSRYYYLNRLFCNNICELLNDKMPFDIKYLINFIKKLLNNPYYKFNILLDKLMEKDFLFQSDGDIIIQKEFETESEIYYDRKRSFASKDAVNKTYAIICPEAIDNEFNFFGYTVIGSSMFLNNNTRLLANSWITNEKKLIPTFHGIRTQMDKNAIQIENITFISNKYNIDRLILSNLMERYPNNVVKLVLDVLRLER
jgi:hypothetical protein